MRSERNVWGTLWKQQQMYDHNTDLFSSCSEKAVLNTDISFSPISPQELGNLFH